MSRGSRTSRQSAPAAPGWPVRSCVACRQRRAQHELVRLTLRRAAGGAGAPTLVLDGAARAPGRGAYLCPRPSCVLTAGARDAAVLRRALRVTSLDAASALDVLLERVTTTDPEAPAAATGSPQP